MPHQQTVQSDAQIVKHWSILLILIGLGLYLARNEVPHVVMGLGAIGFLLASLGLHGLLRQVFKARHVSAIYWGITWFYFVGFLWLVVATGGARSPAVIAFVLFPWRFIRVSQGRALYPWTSVGMVLAYLLVAWLFTPGYPPGALLVQAMILAGVLRLLWYTWKQLAHLLDRNTALIEGLQQQNDELVRASRAKSQLLSQVSHELRNPLSVITSYTELLQEGLRGPIPNAIKADIQLIASSAQQLTFMVDDLLDLNRYELKQLSLIMEPVDMCALMGEIVTAMRPAADAKGIGLSFECTCDPLISVAGDPVRLKQIVSNILNNAVKFTDFGSITVSYRQNSPCALLTVTDTGIGMSQEVQDQLFTPFTVSAANRSRGGAGLGLAIVKRLVDLHMGAITVSSREAAGTTITVELPYWEEP